MSRYIDADDLIFRIRATISINTDIGKDKDTLKDGLMLAEKLVELKCPSIDIVRCKECRYWIGHITDDDALDEYGECTFDYEVHTPQPDDFCSYGEVRDE